MTHVTSPFFNFDAILKFRNYRDRWIMITGQIMQQKGLSPEDWLKFDRWLSNAAMGPLNAAGLVAMAVLQMIYAGGVLMATAAG